MVKKASALAKPRKGVRLSALLGRKGEARRHHIAAALSCWKVTGCSARTAGDKSSFPCQGTLYWSGVHLWEDGTYDIVVPAVRDAIGGGDDFDSALADAREKLAVRVQNSVKEGYSVRMLGKRETALRLKDDMSVMVQQCKVLDMEAPVLKSTKLHQIDLDYGLVCK